MKPLQILVLIFASIVPAIGGLNKKFRHKNRRERAHTLRNEKAPLSSNQKPLETRRNVKDRPSADLLQSLLKDAKSRSENPSHSEHDSSRIVNSSPASQKIKKTSRKKQQEKTLALVEQDSRRQLIQQLKNRHESFGDSPEGFTMSKKKSAGRDLLCLNQMKSLSWG